MFVHKGAGIGVRLIACLALAAGLWGVAHAQDSGSGQEPQSPDDLSQEQILFYLGNEKVAVAGTGFINAQLGDPLQSVLDIWGPPKKQRKVGIPSKIELYYEPDPALAVVFSGRDTVSTISIKGGSAALFLTGRGARMGMPAQIVANLYAFEEVKTHGDWVEFEELGINFHFAEKLLYKVVIYEPN